MKQQIEIPYGGLRLDHKLESWMRVGDVLYPPTTPSPKEAKPFEFPHYRAVILQDRRDGHCWYRIPLTAHMPPHVISMYEFGCRRSTLDAERRVRAHRDLPGDFPIDRYACLVDLGHVPDEDGAAMTYRERGCEDG